VLTRPHADAASRAEDQDRVAGSADGPFKGAYRCHARGRDGGGEVKVEVRRHEFQRAAGRVFIDGD
jgi:hypothetical protein